MAKAAQTEFESLFDKDIEGKLTMFDRMIFKGHFLALYGGDNFANFLWRQDTKLKEFAPWVAARTAQLKVHAQKVAADAGRPYEYLGKAMTRAAGKTKEEQAREIAERDGITEGLICVFGTVEPCRSFAVKYHPIKLVSERRKGLCFYYYFIDPEYGFMHVRLQGWAPWPIQVYLNGREWLCRQLDARGIGYQRYENALLHIDDLRAAQKLCKRFRDRKWLRTLSRWARWVNPLVPIVEAEAAPYYWVLDQCEVATDVMFRSRARLKAIFPALLHYSVLHMSATDVMQFLGRKLHGNFRGEVTTDLKHRPQGFRVKHRMKKNSLKMYDKVSVLRIETTINNPREFKILKKKEDGSWVWAPMGKGVANLWRYAKVAEQANNRYIDALAQARPQPRAVQELDSLCRGRTKNGKHVAKFQPVSREDTSLFLAVLDGDHNLIGFRNRDLVKRLHARPACNQQEQRRRCQQVSRKIAKLRGHGLVRKVQGSRLYRTTARGFRALSAAIRFQHIHLYSSEPLPT
jgi:hypothetical protein